MGAGGSISQGIPGQTDKESLERLHKMWPTGSKCKIHGLQSAAGHQLNGLEAEVRDIDAASGRLILQLHPGDEMTLWKKVKPQNVQWAGVVLVGEPGGPLDKVRNLICQLAGAPQAIDASLLAELEIGLGEAQAKLSSDDFTALQSFAEQARSHASQWLMYHELRVKPDINFNQHGHLSASGTEQARAKTQMASAMKRAYWDVAREALAKPEPDFAFLLSRVEELVETMASFLPATRRESFKDNAMDISLLRMQVDNRAFDYQSLVDLVRRLCVALMELESPFQSARTREWLDEFQAKPVPDSTGFREDVVASLSYLFDRCDVLRMEVQNFGLQQIRATKLQELERNIFSQMVNLNILNLDVTKSCFASVDHAGNVEIAVIKITASLLREKDALPFAKCPEPLRCDLRSLQEFQSGLQGVVLCGLAAIVATPYFPTNTSKNDAKGIFSMVAKEIQKPQPNLDQICKVLEDGIADLRYSKQEPAADFEKLDQSFKMFKKCLGDDVPAFCLLHDRVRKAFATALGPPRREVVPTSLGDTPWSLCYAVDHLNSLLEKVWTFLGDHLQVYRPVYSEILSARACAAASSAKPLTP